MRYLVLTLGGVFVLAGPSSLHLRPTVASGEDPKPPAAKADEPAKGVTAPDIVEQDRLRQRNISNVPLRPDRTGNVVPGYGVDMSDSLYPIIKNRSAFNLKVGKNTDSPVSRRSEFFQTTTVHEEAYYLSTYFDAKFGPFGNASAAYKKADALLQSSTVFYIVLRETTGSEAYEGEPTWVQPPNVAKQLGAQGMLTAFTQRYGSHFVARVYWGKMIVIRAALSSRQQDHVESFRAALNLAFGGFGVKAGIDTETRNRLSRGDVQIEACIVGGGKLPVQNALMTSFGTVYDFISKYNAGDPLVQVQPGPISMDVESYWYTLGEHKDVQKLFEPSVRFLSKSDVSALAELVSERIGTDLAAAKNRRLGLHVMRAEIYHKMQPPANPTHIWIPANKGQIKLPAGLPKGAKVIEAWPMTERGQALWKHFDYLDVGRTDDSTICVTPVSPQDWPAGSVGLKIYILYSVE